MKKASLVVAFCMLLLPIVGLADTIDFSNQGILTGSLVVNPTASGVNPDSITGTNLGINYVEGQPTNSHSGVAYAVTNGVLNFSGSFVGFNSVTDTYTFDLTSLTIKGGVPAAGVANGTTLMTYTGGGSLDLQLSIGPTGEWEVQVGGDDTKNVKLTTFFGEPSTGWQFGGYVIFDPDTCAKTDKCGARGTPGIFHLTPEGSADIPNFVTEPTTISLLTLGLL